MAQRQDPKEREFTAGLCRRNALHVVKLAWTTHPHIGFDRAGVRWLDRYIETSHHHLADDMIGEFVQLMGCFYGECLIETFGGSWAWSSEKLGVFVDPLGYTYPFDAVAKQLRDGADASVATAFLTAVEYLSDAA